MRDRKKKLNEARVECDIHYLTPDEGIFYTGIVDGGDDLPAG